MTWACAAAVRRTDIASAAEKQCSDQGRMRLSFTSSPPPRPMINNGMGRWLYPACMAVHKGFDNRAAGSRGSSMGCLLRHQQQRRRPHLPRQHLRRNWPDHKQATARGWFSEPLQEHVPPSRLTSRTRQSVRTSLLSFYHRLTGRTAKGCCGVS